MSKRFNLYLGKACIEIIKSERLLKIRLYFTSLLKIKKLRVRKLTLLLL
jgi:hypothetical protein